MRIKVTTAFNDRQATEGDDPFVPIDTAMTVTAERGQELCDLGFAIDADSRKDAEPRKSAASGRRPVAKAATPRTPTPPPAPAPEPEPDASNPDPATSAA